MGRGGEAAVTCLALLLFGSVSACGDAKGHDGNGGVSPGVSDPEVAAAKPASSALAFERCSLATGGNDGRAECVTVDVPLDWAVRDGARASFFVKRIIGSSTARHRQLWLLQGGPGDAGDGLESLAEAIARTDHSLDVYIPDHRGTGRSTKLDCPSERSGLSFDYDACMTAMKTMWGLSGLATFSTTTAARDVGYVIDKVRAPDQEVHIYGVSYGTYWAQRYLQLFPQQPTAVVLDGLCQSGLCSYLKSGYWLDRVGKKYLMDCAADATCGAMLGPSPITEVSAAIARAGAKTCSGLKLIDGDALRRIYGWLITSFELRALIPATAYRILRCDADDVVALQKFESVMADGAGQDLAGLHTAAALASDMLGRNIAFSELEEDPPPSRDDLAALLKDAVFTTSDPTVRDEYDNWPRYPHDAFVGQYPVSSVPVLMMNGTLDPQTPEEFAAIVAPHYERANQGLVLLPRAAHGVVLQSPVSGPATQPTCGMTLWHQFLQGPTAVLDTSCRDAILAHDFDGSPELAAHFFGTTTLWGDAVTGTSTPVSPAKSQTAAPGGSAALDVELRRAVRAAHPFF